jgi:hypothetical protein
MGEFIAPDDPRWDWDMVSDWVKRTDIAKSEEDYITSKLKPIASKCLGCAYGNHEWEFRRHKYGDVHAHICDNLGVRNIGFSSFIDLLFRRESSRESHRIRICGTHGASSAILPSGKLNILTKWMNNNQADIYWYAHMHDILHKAKLFMSVSDNGKLVNKEAIGVITGCFFKTYVQGSSSTYGERKTYPLNKIGYPIIEINIEEMTLQFSEKVYLRG